MTLALGLTLVVSLGLSAGAQSLADLARKTQAEREKSKTPAAQVITNDDLKPGRVPSDTPAADPNASADILKKDAAKPEKPAAKPGTSDAKPPALTAKDEEYWRGQYKQLNAWLEENMKKASDFGGQLRAVQSQLADAGLTDSRRAVLSAERTRLFMETQAAEAAMTTQRAAIKKLEEDGRKAGAPPEWFR